MNILMMTNTYLPFVGGVPKSVELFTEYYRRHGHRVVVVAPEFKNRPKDEQDVIRVPAVQNFNGTDFSVRLPIPGFLSARLEHFQPHVVHAHHPFLLGVTALRIAHRFQIPLIFTHHTLYEQYTHYLPVDNPAVRKLAVEIAVRYANLCDEVFAPSQSLAAILRERGVTSPLDVVPTGVKTEQYARGNGQAFRHRQGIPEGAFVVGHVGRLAREKNLPFLARAVSLFLKEAPEARFLVIGQGPAEDELKELCRQMGTAEKLRLVGTLEGQELIDAYQAMDVFVFASKSETQGMVLVEAMAAGTPVVALDAPGARDVVEDHKQGRLLEREDESMFAAALRWIRGMEPSARARLVGAARKQAEAFSMEACANKALAMYQRLWHHYQHQVERDESLWGRALRRIETEWDVISQLTTAAERAVWKELERLS